MNTLSKYFPLLFALFLFSSLPMASSAQSSDEEAISSRILQRVDAVDTLKLSGKLGENYSGLLEQRGPLSPQETALMNAENSDRRALYTIIAKRLGLTMTTVGQGRAEELRKKSTSGIWLQDRSGNWSKK